MDVTLKVFTAITEPHSHLTHPICTPYFRDVHTLRTLQHSTPQQMSPEKKNLHWKTATDGATPLQPLSQAKLCGTAQPTSPGPPTGPRGLSQSSGSQLTCVFLSVRPIDQSRQLAHSVSTCVCLQIHYSLRNACSAPAPCTLCLNLQTFVHATPFKATGLLQPATSFVSSCFPQT